MKNLTAIDNIRNHYRFIGNTALRKSSVVTESNDSLPGASSRATAELLWSTATYACKWNILSGYQPVSRNGGNRGAGTRHMGQINFILFQGRWRSNNSRANNLDREQVSKDWCESAIVPIYNRDDRLSCGSYGNWSGMECIHTARKYCLPLIIWSPREVYGREPTWLRPRWGFLIKNSLCDKS